MRAARGEAGARRAWGSDSDPDESEEWEDYDEAYSEEYESDEEVRVRTPGVAACGFMVPASHQTTQVYFVTYLLRGAILSFF